MSKQEVIDLMKSSKNKDEWNDNCDKVKEECGGYPLYWYEEIILSGLCDKTLGSGSSQISLSTF